jgi:hypothetical protein
MDISIIKYNPDGISIGGLNFYQITSSNKSTMQKILIYFTVVERKITAPFQQHSISDKCKHKSRLLQYDLLHYLQRVMLRGFYDRTAIHGHIEMLSAVT